MLEDYLDAYLNPDPGVPRRYDGSGYGRFGDIPLPGGGSLPPVPVSTSGTSPTSFVRPTTPLVLPGEPAWYDWSHQTRAWAGPKTLQFGVMLGEVRRETGRLQAAYDARIRGATFDPKMGEYTTFRMPATGSGGGCPVLGAIDFIYPDIFGGCQIQLKRLADFPPPRWTPVAAVFGWGELVRWNIALLAVATNIRPMFLFPQTTPRGVTDPALVFRGTNTRTKRTCTGDCARPEGWVDGAPYNTYVGTGFSGSDAPLAERMLGPQEWLDYVTDRITTFGREVVSGTPFTRLFPNALIDGFPFVGGPSTYPWITSFADAAGPHYPGDLVRYLANEEMDTRGQYRTGQYTKALRLAFPIVWENLHPWANPLGATSPTSGGAAVVSPLEWISGLVARAAIFSRLSLSTLIAESLGFYVFNHNVFYQRLLGLSPDQVAAQQRAVINANLQGNEVGGTILAATTAVVTIAAPVAGVLMGVLQAVSSPLMDALLLGNLSVDGPRPLFIRLPSSACPQPTAEQIAAELQRRQDAARGAEACPPGQVRAASGACGPPPTTACPAGQVRLPSGACGPPPTTACPAGQIRLPSGACGPPPAECLPGQTLGPDGTCVTPEAPKASGGGWLLPAGAALIALRLLLR